MALGGIQWFRGGPEFEAERIKSARELAAYGALGRAGAGAYGALTGQLNTIREQERQLEALRTAMAPPLTGEEAEAGGLPTEVITPTGVSVEEAAGAPGGAVRADQAGDPGWMRRIGAVLGLAEPRAGMTRERGQLEGALTRMREQRKSITALTPILERYERGAGALRRIAPDVVPAGLDLGARVPTAAELRAQRAAREHGLPSYAVTIEAQDLAQQRHPEDPSPTLEDMRDASRIVDERRRTGETVSQQQPSEWALPGQPERYETYQEALEATRSSGLVPYEIKGPRVTQRRPGETAPAPGPVSDPDQYLKGLKFYD